MQLCDWLGPGCRTTSPWLPGARNYHEVGTLGAQGESSKHNPLHVMQISSWEIPFTSSGDDTYFWHCSNRANIGIEPATKLGSPSHQGGSWCLCSKASNWKFYGANTYRGCTCVLLKTISLNWMVQWKPQEKHVDSFSHLKARGLHLYVLGVSES